MIRTISIFKYNAKLKYMYIAYKDKFEFAINKWNTVDENNILQLFSIHINTFLFRSFVTKQLQLSHAIYMNRTESISFSSLSRLKYIVCLKMNLNYLFIFIKSPNEKIRDWSL
jgi:hypothetical protein